MSHGNETDKRIPVMCADESAVLGAEIFEPNYWTGRSKGIIQSCWTEYSVLHYYIDQISSICGNGENLCQKQIELIQEQWSKKAFDFGKVVIFGQQPDLHMRIEAFFSGVKSLLDLLMQLLCSEKVVSGFVDGFHRAKGEYGGKVLNILSNNALTSRRETVEKITSLIVQHKNVWIDEAVFARDRLIHPASGMNQLMFQLEFSETNGKLTCVKLAPPQIASLSISQFAKKILTHVQEFSKEFLSALK